MKVHQEPANDVRVVLSDAFPQLVIALLNLVPLVSSERAIRRMQTVPEQRLDRHRLGRGLIRQPQTPRSQITHRGPTQHAHDLARGPTVIAHGYHVRHLLRQLAQLHRDHVHRRPSRKHHHLWRRIRARLEIVHSHRDSPLAASLARLRLRLRLRLRRRRVAVVPRIHHRRPSPRASPPPPARPRFTTARAPSRDRRASPHHRAARHRAAPRPPANHRASSMNPPPSRHRRPDRVAARPVRRPASSRVVPRPRRDAVVRAVAAASMIDDSFAIRTRLATRKFREITRARRRNNP